MDSNDGRRTRVEGKRNSKYRWLWQVRSHRGVDLQEATLVRRGLSVLSLMLVEYWIAWSSRAMTTGGAARLEAVIARSEATKQSILPLCRALDCFASLAMTASGILDRPVKPGEDERVAV